MMAAAHTHAPPPKKVLRTPAASRKELPQEEVRSHVSAAPQEEGIKVKSQQTAKQERWLLVSGVAGGVFLEEFGGWLLLLVLGRGRGTRGAQGRGHLQWWWTLLAVDGTATTAPLPFLRRTCLSLTATLHQLHASASPLFPSPPTHYPHGMHTPFPTWPPTPLVSEPACWHSRQV